MNWVTVEVVLFGFLYSECVSEGLEVPHIVPNTPLRWLTVFFVSDGAASISKHFLLRAAGCCAGLWKPRGRLRIYHLVAVYLPLLFSGFNFRI